MPQFNFPNISALKTASIPKIDNPILKSLNLQDPHWASEYHKRLSHYIIEFEKSLTDEEDLAIKLVAFGESITIDGQ